jgi:hypothetical protein
VKSILSREIFKIINIFNVLSLGKFVSIVVVKPVRFSELRYNLHFYV